MDRSPNMISRRSNPTKSIVDLLIGWPARVSAEGLRSLQPSDQVIIITWLDRARRDV